MDAIDHDLKNTVFSFIHYTAEMSYYGMIKATEDYLSDVKKRKIQNLDSEDKLYNEKLNDILSIRTRGEKLW